MRVRERARVRARVRVRVRVLPVTAHGPVNNPGDDLPTLLLWSVPLLYAASAAVFVYAGEVEGGNVQLRPGGDRD